MWRSLICSLAQHPVSLCACRPASQGRACPSPCRHKAANRNKPDQSSVRGRSVTHTHVSTPWTLCLQCAMAYTHTSGTPYKVLLDTCMHVNAHWHTVTHMPTTTHAHDNCSPAASWLNTHIHIHIHYTCKQSLTHYCIKEWLTAFNCIFIWCFQRHTYAGFVCCCL